MKNELSGKQKPNFLLDMSFVMCSCAKQPPAGLDKLDTECFEYYRLLRATDKNNGVFGRDSMLIGDLDCVPFINMDNFNCCQADHYVSALNDIAKYAYDKMMECEIDTAQYELYKNKYLTSSEYANFAISQMGCEKSVRNYQCVLELIDSWFNVNDNVLMSNAIEKVIETKKIQADYAAKVEKALADLKDANSDSQHAEFSDYIDQRTKDFLNGPTLPQQPSYFDLPQFTPPEPYFNWDKPKKEENQQTGDIDMEAEQKRYEEWVNESKVLDELSLMITECINRIDKWIKASASDGTSLFLADDTINDGVYIDDIDVILVDIKNIKEEINNIIKGVQNAKKIAVKHKVITQWNTLNQKVTNISTYVGDLEEEIKKLRESIYKRKTVTENSFLVCRCGGIIKVIQNADWVNQNKANLQPNMVELLLAAEQYIYKLQNPNLPRDTRYSIIKAFNIVHGAAFCMNEYKPTGLEYIIDKNCEEAKMPAAHIEITVRPAQDLLKQAKRLDAIYNTMSLIPNFIGAGFTLGLSFQSLVESENFLSTDNINPAVAIGGTIYSNLVEFGYITSEIGLGAGLMIDTYNKVATLVTIFQDLTYKSYAAFIGEIKIKVTTFCEHYEIKGTYNILGMREGDIVINRTPYTKSDFLLGPPEDNRTKINYRIYEDGIFNDGEYSDIMY